MKNSKLWLFLIIIAFFGVILTNCSTNRLSVKSLSDSRFNDSFTGIIGGSALDLSNQSFLTCIFNGTNKVWMEVSRNSNEVEVYNHSGYAEWQLSGKKYRYRGWGDDSWSSWAEYRFTSPTTLELQWDPRYSSGTELEWVTLNH